MPRPAPATSHPKSAATPEIALGLGVVAMGLLLMALIPVAVERPPALFGLESTALDSRIFPFGVAICMVLAGAAQASIGYRNAVRQEPSDDDADGAAESVSIKRILACLSIALTHAALLLPLGFVFSSALAVIALALLGGARAAIPIGLTAIGVPLAIYLVFTRLLQVHLPAFPGI